MNMLTVDVAVIGAGTAGLAAYDAARKEGATAVLIEGGPYGTTCARVGCMPSKLLIAAAEAAHTIDVAPAFGVHVDGQVHVNGREVMARVRTERDRFVSYVMQEIERVPASDLISGHARFLDDHTLQIGDHTRVSARSVVIATGARATSPDSFVKLGDRLITSDAVFEWEDLPKSLCVIGPGAIGLELGQALRRLRVRVVVLGRGGAVGPISDPDIRTCTIATLGDEFPLDPDAHIADMQLDGAHVTIRRNAAGGAELTERFDYVLVATGRKPNIDGLDIERTTLVLDAAGVPTFDSATARTQSTAGPSAIFIAGDASDFIPLLHEALDEGRIAGRNAARLALGITATPGLRRTPLGIVFTDPQIAIVGGGWPALEPGTFAVGEASFENQGRATILLRNKGLLRVYGEIGTGRFLGAEMIAPSGEHLGHLLAWALQNEMTVAQMLEMPYYHPVIEEGLRTALRDLHRKL
jgi:dihydrolipoamide dehydrogenase